LVFTGHPIFIKAILISLELVINIIILLVCLHQKWNFFISLVCSIIISKVCYYFMKYCAISFGLIDTELFSTGILLQIGTVFIISFFLFLLFRKSSLRLTN
jgi:hypothetical protein